MTKMRWPAPRNPRPRAAARVAQQILDADRARRIARQENAGEEAAVLDAMPGAASALAERTGVSIDRVGAALSRLKATDRARKHGREWRRT
jgi:predicted Rossmann fold nucleotide-binding protein DprA/Smf involved in DNA uptake